MGTWQYWGPAIIVIAGTAGRAEFIERAFHGKWYHVIKVLLTPLQSAVYDLQIRNATNITSIFGNINRIDISWFVQEWHNKNEDYIVDSVLFFWGGGWNREAKTNKIMLLYLISDLELLLERTQTTHLPLSLLSPHWSKDWWRHHPHGDSVVQYERLGGRLPCRPSARLQPRSRRGRWSCCWSWSIVNGWGKYRRMRGWSLRLPGCSPLRRYRHGCREPCPQWWIFPGKPRRIRHYLISTRTQIHRRNQLKDDYTVPSEIVFWLHKTSL